MFLVQLIYASKVSDMFLPGDVESILETARVNNKALGITGMLCFNSTYFLQCLEGSRAAVNKIFNTISADSRHESMLILAYSEIYKRDFGDWDMGYVSESKLKRKLMLKYASTDIFNPFSMQGESALNLLSDLKSELS
jgi:hypothetical protein